MNQIEISEEAKAELLGYLWKQFPATIGHIPLGEKIDNAINSAIEKLKQEIAELHKVNEDFDKAVAEVATFKANNGSVDELNRLRRENEQLKIDMALGKTK